ncbi:MAG: T9SS type A sorting domain-containing protein [Marinilabilia sp.]
MKHNLPFKIIIPLIFILFMSHDTGLRAETAILSEEFDISSTLTLEQDDVNVWPNPATDVLNVAATEPLRSVELLNMTGQTEKKVQVNEEHEVTLPVSDLPRGIYLLRLTPVSGDRVITKVILK